MLKDIAGIRVCGANFENSSDILFLDPHNGNKIKKVKGSLLYGRNGAGKSTLAKAVKSAKGEVQEAIIQADFLDSNNSPFELTPEDKSHIFVFDEEYVDKNIKIQESGLNTIVMLGHQVELAEQIQTERKDLEELKTARDAQEAIVQTYEKDDTETSPKYHMKKMRYALQGDDCWAGRDKLIKGNRQNTSVHNDTYKHLVPFSTSKTRDQLIVEFNETLKSLREAQQGNATISSSISTFNIHYDEEKIMRLLKMKIEKPELTEREHYLLELAQTGNTSQLNRMVTIFSNKNVCACPVCMQPVSEEYKQNLVQSVQKVLSKAVEEHQESLRQFIMDEIEFNFSPFIKLANTDLCSKLLLEFNAAIKYNNLVIQSKIDDPYTPCEQQLQPISTLLTRLNVAFEKLECERIEYNKEITATKPIVDHLTKINNQIAHFDIQDSYLRYLACAAQAKKDQEKLVELQNASARTKHRLDELEAMQKNVQVAVSIINNNLNYIFFSNTRFKIDYRNGNYILLSNGKSVRPSQVSQGERNIIGLCYFFASILQNQEESSGYTKEYLLVIDDPVSSFDVENRVGILSFLRYKLNQMISACATTKVLMMSHDVSVIFDLQKVMDEVSANCAEVGKHAEYCSFQLVNKRIVPFKAKSHNEYTRLMKCVYEYGRNPEPTAELTIGNMTRRVLEAFSTFTFKEGPDKVSLNPQVLALIPDQNKRAYFQNSMYRLVLNTESHLQEAVQGAPEMSFFSHLTVEEKQRTARDVLCFMYCVNPAHVLAHLPNARKELDNWMASIG